LRRASRGGVHRLAPRPRRGSNGYENCSTCPVDCGSCPPCATIHDCVGDGCCRGIGCVHVSQAPNCSGIACNADCYWMIGMNCMQGYCDCLNGECVAVYSY
jgi:hypothetical protein